MQYGYFDLKNKEYVIDRPDTPAPWVNYLGSPEYGAMISNNAAGYSFVKSGANGRISRFRFNSMMALPERHQGLLVCYMAAGRQAAGFLQERLPPRYCLHRNFRRLCRHFLRSHLLCTHRGNL